MAYTDETKVKGRCLLITTSPTTAAINTFISHAEAKIDAAAMTAFTTAEVTDKLPEQIATDLAAFWAISADVSVFTNNSQAALTANMLYEAAASGLEELKDDRKRKYLQG